LNVDHDAGDFIRDPHVCAFAPLESFEQYIGTSSTDTVSRPGYCDSELKELNTAPKQDGEEEIHHPELQ